MNFITVIIIALVFTVVLFIAHSLPFNESFIEANLIKNPKSPIWWGVAFGYYFVFYLVTMVVINGYIS